MKIWLDDTRPIPDPSWIPIRNYIDMVRLVRGPMWAQVEEISLDHDLGDSDGDGTTLVVEIAKRKHQDGIFPKYWGVHSMNPVGKRHMEFVLATLEGPR